jgi:hypothetical protein
MTTREENAAVRAFLRKAGSKGGKAQKKTHSAADFSRWGKKGVKAKAAKKAAKKIGVGVSQ